MKTIRCFLAVVGLALACTMPVVAADTATEIKTRMEQRLSKLDVLKSKGAIGENNQGQLTALGALKADEATLVAAENADRLAVYAALAAKTGTTPALVADRRAKQIAGNASAGTKIQGADGKWTTK